MTQLLAIRYHNALKADGRCIYSSMRVGLKVIHCLGSTTTANKPVPLYRAVASLPSEILTLIRSIYPQYFKNIAIVLCGITNEYFQYLFGSWDCYCTKFARNGRPETTLLYQIVQEYWPEFQAELASHGKNLPAYVTKEFDEYLKCGRLEHG